MRTAVARNREHYINNNEMTEEEASINICGTVGCIAGHCCFIAPENLLLSNSLIEVALKFLYVSRNQGNELFMPDNQYASYTVGKKSKRFVTRARAIRVLENLLETGKVDWSVA